MIAICSAAVYKPSAPLKIGYWGANPNGKQSTVDQLEAALDNGYNVVIVSFYAVQADGKINLQSGSATPMRKSQLHTTTQFTYLASLFGGDLGIAPSITMSADAFASAMFNNFVALSQQYEFDGISIDLNMFGQSANVMECALRSFFRLMHNAGYVVSLAPQSLAVTPLASVYSQSSWNAYAPLLDTGIIDNIDIVAIQMHTNQIYGDNVATYTDALVNGFAVSGSPTCDGTVTGRIKIPASKLAHGWPAAAGIVSGCPGQTGGCPFGSALTNLYAGSASLKATAGVMAWAIEHDQANNWQFVKAASRIAFSASAATSPVATQAPARPAATQAPTVKPVVAATAAPIVQSTPKPAAPVATAAPSAPSVGPSCKMTWSQKLSSSWTQGCNTITMYTVTMYADAPLADFRFKLSGGVVQSVWDANEDSGAYKLPSWLFSSGGKMPKGQVYSFGYIVVSDQPATISVIGDPCQ